MRRMNEDKSTKSSRPDFLTMPYEEQLAQKQKRMETLLGSFGKVLPILPMENPMHYRNKVHAVFGRDGRGRVLCGEYKEGTHRIIERKDSPIEDETCRNIIQTIKKMVIRYKIRIYDEDLRTGLLRHVVVRRGFASREIMVILVCASPVFPSVNRFVKELLSLHPEITTIVLNVNDRKTNAILGNREKTLFGKGYITDTLCGCTFRISPDSFYQVNPAQTEILYETAIGFAALQKEDTALDAYCGIGTIGIIAAKKAGGAQVTGVERNESAVRDAHGNAKANNITNIRFITKDASDYMDQLAASLSRGGARTAGSAAGNRGHAAPAGSTGKNEKRSAGEGGSPLAVLFMDPPRSGSDERFLRAAAALSPERIVYISCGPESLARDLAELKKMHYKVRRIQPVDMFPFTPETETVCLLTRS